MSRRPFHGSSLKEELTEDIHELFQLTKKVKRTPFVITVVVVGLLTSTLSENLTFGPSWALLVVILAMLIPLYIAILRGHYTWTRRLAFVITSVITAGLVISVVSLVYVLFHHPTDAVSLFRNAILLWSANILVFSAWYWEIDMGGPIRRRSSTPYRRDFLFPQNMTPTEDWKDWKPSFSDYLFLAFNTSTAFSPTDTTVLSRRAKILMMTQSSISLTVVAVLAARAINIIS